MNQLSFAQLAYQNKKKTTRREKFLQEMNEIIPWQELESEVAQYYPEAGNGRPPIGLKRMLRIYFMQQWFNLSDPAAEDALYDSEAMRSFAGIELGSDPIPDETTILNFRHLLEANEATRGMFERIRLYLRERGLLVNTGTIVDASIIDAPTSTKNRERKRDPEMHQVKKGNEWYFGMKVHVGTETTRGLVHSLKCTPANVHDGVMLPKLLHGKEKQIFGDCAYVNEGRKLYFQSRGVRWRISRRAKPRRSLSKKDRLWNRSVSRVRAKGEHAFQVVKSLWGHAKVRYRGIRKNTAQFYSLFALANLYLVRRQLLETPST